MHFMALSWSQIHSLQRVQICFTVNDLLAPHGVYLILVVQVDVKSIGGVYKRVASILQL